MMELPVETRIYEIAPAFARDKGLPCYFAARPIIQTKKAAYLVGRGTTRTTHIGVCMSCGRTLTHPVSVELGIGPECGKHFWDWDLIGGYSKENLERLKSKVLEIVVDGWFPKSVVRQLYETDDHVTVPEDHPMLKPKDKANGGGKKAIQVKYQDSGRAAIKIMFPFNWDVMTQVKTLSGRRFHDEGAGNRYWTCPLSIDSVNALKDWGFELDQKLEDFLAKALVHVDDVSGIDVPGLKMSLFPFQKQGVAFIEAKNGRALIASEMGLGKTAQALAWLQLHPEKRPAVVVVPASLKLNWAKEAKMWMQNPNVQVLHGTKPNVPIIGDILVINYDILPNEYETYRDETGKKKKREIPRTGWVDYLIDTKPQVIITDEVHYIKEGSTNRTKATLKLAKYAPHVIGLSGTPIVNRPVEGINAIRMIDPTVIGNPWDFKMKYCGAYHNGFGWDFNGATNTDELHHRLTHTIMLRHKKADVLTDLPDKIRSFLPMELDNTREYDKAENDFVEWVRGVKGDKAAERVSNAEQLAKIEALKQLAVKGKLKQAISWIRDFIDTDGKLVVFAVHKFVIDALMKEFGGLAVKVDGSVTGQARQDAVDRFQEDDSCRLFIGNVKAAGVGLTLTAASNVAFLELPWAPGDVSQAEDRCHRIGQKDSVSIYYLLAAGSIEEQIAKLLDKKRKILDKVLDGEETDAGSLLGELMDSYSKTA